MALEGSEQLDAALWDLRQAQQLLPGNKQVAEALGRVEAADRARPALTRRTPRAANSPLDGGMDFSKLLQGLGGEGGGGGGGMDGLASMLGGLGGGPSGAAGGGGGGGLLDMLGGGGEGGGLEALLRSPIIRQHAGKGGSRMLALVGNLLAARRKMKQARYSPVHTVTHR